MRISDGRTKIIVRIIPIGAPLVDILRHVVKPKAVRRPLTNSLGSTQPECRVVGLIHRRLVAPRVEFTLESSARGSFPLGFCRKAIEPGGLLREPFTVCGRVEPAYAGNRLIGVIE